jgi:23S rRNA (uridine2552-2'-O)-methyltransferase
VGRKARGSSRAWIAEHERDNYVRRARSEGVRSRAAYKLEQLDRRDRLLRPGMIVVDLGAAPGGWSQYAVRRLSGRGRVVAVDLLAMDPIAGVDFIQGDFTDSAVVDALLERLGETRVDLVLSDMAPNISGVAGSDQARAMALCEAALCFALQVLAPGGRLLVKAFQGAGLDELRREMGGHFRRVLIRKPEASRSRSRELYLLADGFLGGPGV